MSNLEMCTYCRKPIRQRDHSKALTSSDRHPTTIMPYHCKCVGKSFIIERKEDAKTN